MNALLVSWETFGADNQVWRKAFLDAPEIRQSICLIVRTIKLTLSLTTSTQAVLCSLYYTFRAALRAPIQINGKIHSTTCVDVAKLTLSIRLIGLTIRQMLCLISGPLSKPLLDFWTSSKASNSLNKNKQKQNHSFWFVLRVNIFFINCLLIFANFTREKC